MPWKSPNVPTRRRQLARARASRADLLTHGIDLRDSEHQSLYRLVRFHLDYFQCMLGYDATPREIVSLLEEAERSSNPPAADASGGDVAFRGRPGDSGRSLRRAGKADGG